MSSAVSSTPVRTSTPASARRLNWYLTTRVSSCFAGGTDAMRSWPPGWSWDRRDAQLAAGLVLLIHEHHVVAAAGGDVGGLHACGARTHNKHVLLLGSRLKARLVVLDIRVDRAGNGLAEHDAVQAAQAADAGADLLGAARSGLVAELGVAQACRKWACRT